MPPRRIRAATLDDYADFVVQAALEADWVKRHVILSGYMKTRLGSRIAQRLSPCESIYGTCTGERASGVIVLPDKVCDHVPHESPKAKKRKTVQKIVDIFGDDSSSSV